MECGSSSLITIVCQTLYSHCASLNPGIFIVSKMLVEPDNNALSSLWWMGVLHVSTRESHSSASLLMLMKAEHAQKSLFLLQSMCCSIMYLNPPMNFCRFTPLPLPSEIPVEPFMSLPIFIEFLRFYMGWVWIINFLELHLNLNLYEHTTTSRRFP